MKGSRRKTPNAVWSISMTDVNEEKIKQRAHELWEIAGRPDGRDDEFWHKAEEQVRGEVETYDKLRTDPTITTNS